MANVVVLANADDNFMTNINLEAVVDWIPGLPNIRLSTFRELDKSVLDAMLERIRCPMYPIRPFASFSQSESNDHLQSVSMRLRKEEDACVEWLNDKEPKSVVYVNFGSATVLTRNQLNEFSWGLANSQRPFIWVIHEGLVIGELAMIGKAFVEATKERALILR
ncbi:hypothetical protein AMTR_s00038p00221760 [Amborella trichopoda]|uniref:Uncharacterized protein n=1 Tax=Amborella trichopoda TaxID=13333 RepID=U5CX17_AMBTC|nr:hypothetical protein AMTR_s00038p00221760 [Amborella trichopoda]